MGLRLAHDDVRWPTTVLTILNMSLESVGSSELVEVIPANQRELGCCVRQGDIVRLSYVGNRNEINCKSYTGQHNL